MSKTIYCGQSYYGSGFDLMRHLSGIAHALKGVRTNFKPAMRDILSKLGDIPIVDMVVVRRPLSSKFNAIIGFIGKVTGSKGATHDKLFHLMLVINLSNGSVVQLEKNEDLNIDYYKKSTVDEVIPVQTPQGATLNILLQNAISKFGNNRIFEYDGFTNNCQKFIMDLLVANNVPLNPTETQFILQDVSQLVPAWAQRMAHGVTSFYNRLKMAITGYGQNIPRNYCVACGGKVHDMRHHVRTNNHIKRVLKVYY